MNRDYWENTKMLWNMASAPIAPVLRIGPRAD
jgi:hypothetical protein